MCRTIHKVQSEWTNTEFAESQDAKIFNGLCTLLGHELKVHEQMERANLNDLMELIKLSICEVNP